MNPEQLRDIIINELDLEGLPSDVQGAVVVRLSEEAVKQIILDCYDALLSDDKKELKQLMAGGSSVELRAWLNEKIPNFSEIAEAATKRTIDDYHRLRLEAAG